MTGIYQIDDTLVDIDPGNLEATTRDGSSHAGT
jgi:hypothetical protein